jgi:hypothetical protein
MCWECDNPGGDFEAHLIEVIEQHGWTLVGVEGSVDRPPCVYTVGLPYQFGHPELLMVGNTPDTGAVLNGIGDYIRDTGRTIRAGETMRLGDRSFGFGVVSRSRRRAGEIVLSERVNARLGVYRVSALEVVRLEELEVCSGCFDHALHEWMARN